MDDPLLWALLDSIEPWVASIRCVDLTPEVLAAGWFAQKSLWLCAGDEGLGDDDAHGFDLVIGLGERPGEFAGHIAPDGLLLLGHANVDTGPGLRSGWTRIADVSAQTRSWQLWRRHASAAAA